MITVSNLEKSIKTGAGETFLLRRINLEHQAGRVRVDHGAVGSGEVDAAAHPRHARHRLARRVRAARPADAHAAAERSTRAAEETHRVRVPELSPARQPHGLRKHRGAALLPRRAALAAAEHRRRHAGPVSDRRQEGSVSQSAVRRAAAARRRRARGGRQPWT